MIRKITSNGIISIVAGTGSAANSLDGGMATSTPLGFPSGVVVDGSNNIFIADHASGRIRMVTSAGIMTTYASAGQIGYGGDGGAATSALFDSPYGVALDPQGNLIVADSNNQIIRKIDKSTQIISIIAGTATSQGSSGDNGAATSANLDNPSRVRFDTSGNLYIADSYNHKVRFVLLSTGIITTFAGTGTAGSSGDGGQATSAQLYYPRALALDLSGNILI